MEALGTAAIAAHDAETRFHAMAAGADRGRALAILDRLDAGDRAGGTLWYPNVWLGQVGRLAGPPVNNGQQTDGAQVSLYTAQLLTFSAPNPSARTTT